MKIYEAKASSYDTVDTESIYDYIREYVNKINGYIEPEEDRTGNAYKKIKERYATKDRTQLKIIAASLETICKRLDAMEGKY